MGTQARNIAQILNTDSTITTADIADDAVTGAKIENNPTIAGNLGVAGDLTVDTSSLKVNASNNFIGIGTASPQKKIHILDTTSDGNMIFDRNGTSTDHQIIFAHNYQSGGQSGGNYYGIGVDGSENKLVFAYDANSQASLSADAKMTLNSSGVLSVPSGVELGLNFAGAASNTLNDYEEGTWTPDLRNADNANSFTLEEGYYTKVGNRVFAQFRCDYGNTGGGGGIQIRNLPFTYNGNFSCVGIVAVNGGSMSGNNKQYAVFATSGTTFQIYNGGSISSETYSFLSGSIHYLTNS